MIFLGGWILGLLIALVHVVGRRTPTLAGRLEVFLLYQMVFCIGVAGLFGSYGHCLNYEMVAKSIGWVPHKQFQFELGASEFGWAIAGLLAVVIRKPLYWLGISIIPSTMYFLAGCQHLWEVVARGNYAANNIWPGVADLIVPLTLVVLFAWYYAAKRKEQ
jgi:hypothetical protein